MASTGPILAALLMSLFKQTGQIKNAIYEQMQLKDENKGIIYTLPVIEVRGLIEQQ